MLLLGLGLGLVMQVLVLATQNAVDYRLLGVATSGATLFRQVGGSIGVSVFGAIFRTASAWSSPEPPAGVQVPTDATPAIEQLPARSTPSTPQPSPPRSTPSSRLRPP